MFRLSIWFLVNEKNIFIFSDFAKVMVLGHFWRFQRSLNFVDLFLMEGFFEDIFGASSDCNYYEFLLCNQKMLQRIMYRGIRPNCILYMAVAYLIPLNMSLI